MSQDEQEPSIVEKLEVDIARAGQWLEKGDVKRGMLQIWGGGVRSKLRRIFGDSSDIKACLPEVAEGLSASEHAAILQCKLRQTKDFISAARGALLSSYNPSRGKVFFGHGRSPAWREFKDFVADRLRLPWDEFNRDAVAGLTTFERLSDMLSSASFAFLIMTAEDEHSDSTLHARENVVHEVGLFQGRLGPRRAIILLEDGCNEFSNIVGLSQIRFPKGRPSAAFEEMRRVLERERLLEI